MPIFRDGRPVAIDFSREAARYDEKLKQALRDKLWELIESIQLIGRGRNDPTRQVTLRIRGVKEFRFRFARPEGGGAGQLGDEGGGEGQVPGELAGTEPGEKEYDEYEIDRSALQDMLFERWKLPPPLERDIGPLTQEKKVRLRGLRRKGVPAHLAKRETSRVRLKRLFQESETSEDEGEAIADEWASAPFAEEDLRYYRFEQEEEGTKAVQYCLRDVSGSMFGSKQEMCRVLFTYICAYRERRFPEFEAHYVVHTTEAEETDELNFFRRSSGGGTKMSSALTLMLELIAKHHHPDEWNIYGMYASDGENQSDDNALSVELVEKILDVSRLFVYLETLSSGQTGSPLYDRLRELSKRRRNLVVAKIAEHTPAEVKRVLDTIFEREWEVDQDDSP
jgi:uncharacterized sporulation protein YeaH/YhbH (DUF444 family)